MTLTKKQLARRSKSDMTFLERLEKDGFENAAQTYREWRSFSVGFSVSDTLKVTSPIPTSPSVSSAPADCSKTRPAETLAVLFVSSAKKSFSSLNMYRAILAAPFSVIIL